jgi:polygalacturonase
MFPAFVRLVPLFALLGACLSAAPPATRPSPTLYDIRSLGAVGDGQTLNTASIQSAIDQATAAGGGTVLIAGGTYVTGTLVLKSNVTLHIEAGATLLGSPHIADYSTDTDRTMYAGEPHMNRCLLFARDAVNITIDGMGTIDGNGKAFPEKGDPQKNRPKLIRLLNSSRIRMRDLTLQHPASWTNEWRYCSDIVVEGITVLSRGYTNGDGLDLDGCTKARISNSTFDTGDDAICLQTSAVDHPCSDIAVTNCNFSSRWAGMRIGLLSRGDFSNIAVDNCTFTDHQDSGLKIQMNEGGSMSNMSFSNLVMKNVPRPVFLTFCQKNAWVDAGRDLPPMKFVSNLQFSNIVVDDSGISGNAARTCGFQITGMPDHDIQNLSFSNIRAIFPGTGTAQDAANVLAEFTPQVLRAGWPEYSRFGATVPSFGFYVRHVAGISLRDIHFTTAAPDARPAILLIDVKDVVASGTPQPATQHAPATR